MGLAIDTVLVDVHNAATTAIGLTNGTVTNSGDSLSVRSFHNGYAKLESLFLQGSGTRQARVISPRFHDNVTGLTFNTPESPSEFLFPRDVAQPLYSSDTLTVQLDAAGSSDTVAALLAYYSDIEGIQANLLTWEQVKARMVNLKTVPVAVTTSGTPGTWTDTAITTTENQLKADYSYAVLGFEPSAALACMGLKGPATGNLRVCAPGATATLDITSYFLELGLRQGTPHIPVFKANDRNNTFVSSASNAASVSATVTMICAQLS